MLSAFIKVVVWRESLQHPFTHFLLKILASPEGTPPLHNVQDSNYDREFLEVSLMEG